MTQELKPCPHCGAEAVLTEHEPHDHSPGLVALTGIPAKHPGSWTIECVACSCGMIQATREEVVAAWNRRALATPAPLSDEPVAWNALTDDDRKAAFESLPDMLEGFMKKWGWLNFAKEIERRCREKNAPLAQSAEQDRIDAERIRQAKLEAYESVLVLSDTHITNDRLLNAVQAAIDLLNGRAND